MDEQVQKEIAELSKITREKDGGEKYAEAQLEIGRKYVDLKDDKKALKAWQGISREDNTKEFAKAQLNIGVNYYQQGDTQKALEAWQSISREDDAETFAKSQLNIGLYYHEKGDIQNALKFWKSISRKDNAEQFGRAQFMIGLEYYKQGDAEEALETWQTISREDSSKQFAQAQLNIGMYYRRKGEIPEAIEAWQSIHRKDDAKVFAQAIFYIGMTYDDQGKGNKAIHAWNQINREDDKTIFAQAQLNIGAVYNKEGKIQEAIDAWNQINHDDNKEQFAKAQFNIGLKYNERASSTEAIKYWNQITRDDDKEVFASAQLNMGAIYDKKGSSEEAIQCWDQINRDDDKEVFAQAQFNMGLSYIEHGKSDAAIQCWSQISHEDDRELFAQAQFNIGLSYDGQERSNEAINAWSQIARDDDKRLFAKALFYIGSTYDEQGEINEAIDVWKQITNDDDKEVFAQAQFSIALTCYEQYKIEQNWQNVAYLPSSKFNDQGFLVKYNYINTKKSILKSLQHLQSITLVDGKVYSLAKLLEGTVYFEEKQYVQANAAFDSVPLDSEFKYYAYIYKKISSDDIDDKESFHRLFQLVDKIRDVLFIKLNANDTQFERKLAHYTSMTVVNNLFKDDKSSNFRLNTINNVNDPTEGQLIFEYLSKNKLAGSMSVFDDDYQAFISCFTLNHDHLNQFRLYGKSEGREATGVSLVFGGDFFNASLSYHNISSNNDKTNNQSKMITQLSETLITDKKSETTIPLAIKERADNTKSHCLYQQDKESETPKPKLSSQPVFRCVYVDPQSGFVSIAQRDEITFYRENCFNKTENDIEQSASDWQNYLDFISKKELKVKKLLEDLKNAYQNINETNRKKHKDLIEDILLPIRYLFKHSAFHEEQECRMIHITTLYNELVQTEFDRKFMYINYGEDVKSNIKQVYIGSESTTYQPFIMKLLGQDKAKDVHISHSPFRNK